MTPIKVNPWLAATYWGLVVALAAAVGTLGFIFRRIELRGVHDPAKGDTFSETWFWLRADLPVAFWLLMGLLCFILVGGAWLVYKGVTWLVPHLLFDGP